MNSKYVQDAETEELNICLIRIKPTASFISRFSVVFITLRS